MNKKIFVVITIVGALAAIFLVNRFLGITYDNRGSFDVITGALVETFILTVFFQYAQAQQQKQTDKAMQLHFQQIERMLRDQQAQINYMQPQPQQPQPKKKKRKGQKYVY